MQQERREPRYRLERFLPVSDGESGVALGRIADLSRSGCMVIGKEPLQLDTFYQFCIQLPAGNDLAQDELRLMGRALWSRPASNGGHHGAGIAFQGLTEHEQCIIDHLVQQLQE